MKIWIVWLPNVGKSTLFNALTKSYAAESGNFPFCTIDPNTGIVNVADERLDALKVTVGAKKIIPATVEFTDIAGLVKGASQGEGRGNAFLANIREANAILQVVRDFKNHDVHHVNGSVDAKRDIEIINTELILADIQTLDKKMGETAKKAKSGDKEAKDKEAVYTKLFAWLNAGNIAISCDLTDEEKLLAKDLFLLTLKPFVYAVNVEEDRVNATEEELRNITGIADKNIPIVAICAKLEVDMMEFDQEERKEFLADLGIVNNPVDELIKTCFATLGLQYYFTAGEMEVHAWTIKKGCKAPQAAGEIHTDFEKKFIKAETANWKDLVDNGGWAWARWAGKVRLEGKEYIVQDGDVMVFKFGG